MLTAPSATPMSIILLSVSAVLIWLGVDALWLSGHPSPPGQIERDDMMFGKFRRRPVSPEARSFAERRYPFATADSMRVYGVVFIVAGLGLGTFALGLWG